MNEEIQKHIEGFLIARTKADPILRSAPSSSTLRKLLKLGLESPLFKASPALIETSDTLADGEFIAAAIVLANSVVEALGSEGIKFPIPKDEEIVEAKPVENAILLALFISLAKSDRDTRISNLTIGEIEDIVQTVETALNKERANHV